MTNIPRRAMFLLWVGAAISISEIYTGGLLAPLGLAKGAAAILIGHIIGASLMAFGGYVSFTRGQNAMETVGHSLGQKGGMLVALLNVIQLTGWTIVMIVQAGSAFTSVFGGVSFRLAALILALLVLFWALSFGSRAGHLNEVVVVLLSLLCVLLFGEATQAGNISHSLKEGMSMALAIELSIAMPVSWLPLVGDYSVQAGDKTCAVGMPFAGYFIGSVAMYLFGLYISVSTGGGDIFTFVAASRFRWPACAVVVLSTLTTGFLDLYSAAISSTLIYKPKNKKIPILVFGFLAGAVAVFFPPERYSDFLTSFLTSIGMVFVPVYTVLFLDFLLKKTACQKALHAGGIAIAVLGMLGYRYFSAHEVWIPTVLTILLVAALYIPYSMLKRRELA